MEFKERISRFALSQGLSIGNPTTNIYVRFNQKKIDDANRKVIDYLLH